MHAILCMLRPKPIVNSWGRVRKGSCCALLQSMHPTIMLLPHKPTASHHGLVVVLRGTWCSQLLPFTVAQLKHDGMIHHTVCGFLCGIVLWTKAVDEKAGLRFSGFTSCCCAVEVPLHPGIHHCLPTSVFLYGPDSNHTPRTVLCLPHMSVELLYNCHHASYFVTARV